MAYLGHIPYNPETDPKQYLTRALQQYQFAKGFSPTLPPMQIMQKALQAGIPPQQAMELAQRAAQTQRGFTLGPGETRFDLQGRPIATGAVRPVSPTAQTRAEKDRNRDIKILTDKDKEGKLKATPVQKASARRRLRLNKSLGKVAPGRIDYAEILEVKLKVKVKGARYDKAFGEEAYEQALQEAKDNALAVGATEASAETDFNRWWDEQVAKEVGDTFIEFIPRSEFQGEELLSPVRQGEFKEDIVPLDANDIPSPKTQAEFDALAVGAEFIDTDGKRKIKQ